MAKQGFIYKYTFSNGMVYIGSTTTSVEDSHYNHMYASKNPMKWKGVVDWAISEYGEPTVEAIEMVEVTDEEAGKLSRLLKYAKEKWIKEYDSFIENGKGFNVRGGGRMVHWENYVFQIKGDEIYKQEKWDEKIDEVCGILQSIGNKVCYTKEKLTQEEERIWYRLKFMEYDWEGDAVGKTSFSSFYRRNKDEDWGDVPYETLEIIESKTASAEEKKEARQIQEACFFSKTINNAVKCWVTDIRNSISDKVKKQDPALAELLKIREERKRDGIDRATLKRSARFLDRLMMKMENK
ncbi:MAG: hypothetical protein J6Y39_06565 [Bacteroidaceae bacterium]|nr:hypothetical protein [Bacteroidaceae bacterium]